MLAPPEVDAPDRAQVSICPGEGTPATGGGLDPALGHRDDANLRARRLEGSMRNVALVITACVGCRRIAPAPSRVPLSRRPRCARDSAAAAIRAVDGRVAAHRRGVAPSCRDLRRRRSADRLAATRATGARVMAKFYRDMQDRWTLGEYNCAASWSRGRLRLSDRAGGSEARGAIRAVGGRAVPRGMATRARGRVEDGTRTLDAKRTDAVGGRHRIAMRPRYHPVPSDASSCDPSSPLRCARSRRARSADVVDLRTKRAVPEGAEPARS